MLKNPPKEWKTRNEAVRALARVKIEPTRETVQQLE
jgi:hypothetical protein